MYQYLLQRPIRCYCSFGNFNMSCQWLNGFIQFLRLRIDSCSLFHPRVGERKKHKEEQTRCGLGIRHNSLFLSLISRSLQGPWNLSLSSAKKFHCQTIFFKKNAQYFLNRSCMDLVIKWLLFECQILNFFTKVSLDPNTSSNVSVILCPVPKN